MRRLLSLVFVGACACGGGSVLADGGGDAAGSSDAANAKDGAADAPADAGDGASSGACPASAPADGAACGVLGLDCEYGGDHRARCNVVARCSAGQWHVAAPSGPCATGVDAGCPATYASVTPLAACGPFGLTCSYADGVCGCGRIAHQYDGWQCDAPDQGCPWPRPALGSSCAVPDQTCDYGACTIVGGDRQTCTAGTWREVAVACPP